MRFLKNLLRWPFTTYAAVVGLTFLVVGFVGTGPKTGSMLEAVIWVASWPFLVPGIIRELVAPHAYGLFARLPIFAAGVVIAWAIDKGWHRLAAAIERRKPVKPSV